MKPIFYVLYVICNDVIVAVIQMNTGDTHKGLIPQTGHKEESMQVTMFHKWKDHHRNR